MYLLKFATPMTPNQANRVAAQITASSKVEFAEPNGIVNAVISTN